MTTNTPTPANPSPITPLIILHGGAGNISRATVPASTVSTYRAALHRILTHAHAALAQPDATALDVATYAVSLFEDDPLFNAGRGAVFTRAGTNELEASVMVSSSSSSSRGGGPADQYRKRGAGCMLLRHVKNPIKLAREILVRSEEEDGGGAGGHVQLAGESVEALARGWGVELVEPGYFWTQERWDEHRRGLERSGEKMKGAAVGEGMGEEKKEDGDPSWDPNEYLPQGTVGAVVLDCFGTICAATSTGGLTNKLPGRIGDTPTFGAGFWAEEWTEKAAASPPPSTPAMAYQPPTRSTIDKLSRGDIASVLSDCLPLPTLGTSSSTSQAPPAPSIADEKPHPHPPRRLRHAVGLSGTGNGDSFLQLSAARTAAAIPRFSSSSSSSSTSSSNRPSLRDGLAQVAGPGGELQRSAGEHWKVTGEGQGGMIGVELVVAESEKDGKKEEVIDSWVGYDLNCGGMFRAWVDKEGRERVAVFADEDGLE